MYLNMNMKRIFAVSGTIILVLLVMFLSGCNNGSESDGNGATIQSGTKGIEMNFVSNAPPAQVYVDEGGSAKFEAILELRNKGAYPKEGDKSLSGQLYLTGFDPTVITGNWVDGGPELPVDLNGKSFSFPDGGYNVKTFEGDVNYNYEAESYEPMLMVTACYNYVTKASPLVCIDPTPYSPVSKKKVCTIKNSALSGGQGGPMGVTSIEQAGTSAKTVFKIYISNLGDGRVLYMDSVGNCMNPDFNDVDKVNFEVKISSLGNGDCTPETEVKLQNGKGLIVCSFDNPTGSDAYSTPMDITLKYGYSSTISKKISILKLKN
jgi:hypothetical protein